MPAGADFESVLRLLSPGMRVLLHAGPAECLGLRDALIAAPERAAGVTFTGLFVPGVNDFDYAGLTPTTRVESLFVSPCARASLEAGRLDLLPIHYSSYPRYLARRPADLAILHLPPAQSGRFSCGIGADVAEGVTRFARRVAVLANPLLPVTAGGVALDADAAEIVVEAEGPLLDYRGNGADDPVLAQVAAYVVGLIEDGDTLQVGIGKLPSSVLARVADRRNLRLHSGMLIDEVALLAEAGALAPSRPDAPAILAGIALGGAPVRALAGNGDVRLHGIGVTHDAVRIAALPRFTAINGAVEVDLFGNVNSERVKGRQVSGIGGAGDFMGAARLSPGGRSIIALPSQAKGRSRIVPVLDAGSASIARADLDILVTEHGARQVRDLSLDARAEAIIGLAAPDHRPALDEAWRALRALQ